jgi:hypothetical protein
VKRVVGIINLRYNVCAIFILFHFEESFCL